MFPAKCFYPHPRRTKTHVASGQSIKAVYEHGRPFRRNVCSNAEIESKLTLRLARRERNRPWRLAANSSASRHFSRLESCDTAKQKSNFDSRPVHGQIPRHPY